MNLTNNKYFIRGVKWGAESLAFEGIFKLIRFAAEGIKEDFRKYYEEEALRQAAEEANANEEIEEEEA